MPVLAHNVPKNGTDVLMKVAACVQVVGDDGGGIILRTVEPGLLAPTAIGWPQKDVAAGEERLDDLVGGGDFTDDIAARHSQIHQTGVAVGMIANKMAAVAKPGHGL